jgi:polyhydroxyalkanoate synthase
MSAPAGLNLASIPERIQSEVQRAIQRSIKGVEYIASSGPALGSTPKDIMHVRGTMNLYHYRPIADEIYPVPILIVMATTNRGYILDMVPGQSFIEYLLKRGYDVYMLDWTPPKPEEKQLRIGGLCPRLHSGLHPPRAAGFRRNRCHRDRLLLRRRAVAAVWLDLQ